MRAHLHVLSCHTEDFSMRTSHVLCSYMVTCRSTPHILGAMYSCFPDAAGLQESTD